MLSKSRLTIVFGILLIFIGLVVTGYQVAQPHPAGVTINLWGLLIFFVGIIITIFGSVWKFVSKD
jgi:hypothetical protein